MEPIDDLISNVRTRLILDEQTENSYFSIKVENLVCVQWGRGNGSESECVCVRVSPDHLPIITFMKKREFRAKAKNLVK